MTGQPRASPVDNASPPGAWRAALDPNAHCALCRQRVCAHSDAEYAGLVPLRPEPRHG